MDNSKDKKLISNIADLVQYFAAGEKPPSQWKIGTEHEKFAFLLKDYSPIPYDGNPGIKDILISAQEKLGWESILEKSGHIIGLKSKNNGGSITCEPGGQLELSGAPLENLHQTCNEVNKHLKLFSSIGSDLGVSFLAAGTSPLWKLEEIPRMPKARYKFMERYMPKVGTDGLNMMFRTATVQGNYDYSSEVDMISKMKVGMALQPIITALFANSPFINGKPSGYLSTRSAFWSKTDPSRTGILPFVFDNDFGYQRYTEYALDVPMYFINRDNTIIEMEGLTFRQALENAKYELTIEDWETHISCIFPDVRLKQFIEMRGADAGPWHELCALPSIWTGLIYCPVSIQNCLDYISDWTIEEIQELRIASTMSGLRASFRNRNVYQIASDILKIAKQGLINRKKINQAKLDESIMLAPLEDTLRQMLTPADILLSKYYGSWKENVRPIFHENSY